MNYASHPPFSAVTICSEGMDEASFRAAILKKIFDFAKMKGDSRNISAIVAQDLIYVKVKQKYIYHTHLSKFGIHKQKKNLHQITLWRLSGYDL